MSQTGARRRLVTRLVTTETIESQAQLSRLLSEAGFEVTQATISRDLEAIGATKMRDGDSARYRIQSPDEIMKARSALAATVGEFVGSTTTTGQLIVVQVPPGAAHLVGGRIDDAGVPGVLGTVAGNDTIFVAVDERFRAAEIAAEYLGG